MLDCRSWRQNSAVREHLPIDPVTLHFTHVTSSSKSRIILEVHDYMNIISIYKKHEQSHRKTSVPFYKKHLNNAFAVFSF